MARRAAAIEENSVPDIDRVADFAHPRETIQFFGNAPAEMELLEAARSGRIHHAWLLTGAPGIGKATLAYRFARFLLANPKPEDAANATDLSLPEESAVLSQVAHQSHPNLLVLRRPWQTQRKRHANAITVDEVRRLGPFLGQTAADGTWRIVIIDAADDLNISAVNALLKSLEEPPSACVFLLVSAIPGRLPVTVRSRCRTLRLGPLAPDDLQKAIGQAADALESGNIEQVLALAEGSPGAALRLLEAGGGELYQQLMDILGGMPDCDNGKIHKLAETLSGAGSEDRYALFFTILDGLLGRLVKQAATGTGAHGEEVHLSARLIPADGLAQWAGLWETLQRAKAETDALNLDRKTLVLRSFFKIEENARQGMKSSRRGA